MNGMPKGMLPTVPEADEMPTSEESFRMVGLARGHRELLSRRLTEDYEETGQLPDVLMDPLPSA